jgi:hypothetical protein
MARTILSMSSNPVEELLALIPQPSEDEEVVHNVFLTKDYLPNNLVEFWQIMQTLYQYYPRVQAEGLTDQFITINLLKLNTLSIESFTHLLRTINTLGLNTSFIINRLSNLLSSQGLESINHGDKLLQTLLSYSQHILLFEEKIPIARSFEYEANLSMEFLGDRMLGRKMGNVIKEVCYKTSNEIFIHNQIFNNHLREISTGTYKSTQFSERQCIENDLTTLLLSWAMHWNILGMDSVYVIEATHKKLLHDYSSKV